MGKVVKAAINIYVTGKGLEKVPHRRDPRNFVYEEGDNYGTFWATQKNN